MPLSMLALLVTNVTKSQPDHYTYRNMAEIFLGSVASLERRISTLGHAHPPSIPHSHSIFYTIMPFLKSNLPYLIFRLDDMLRNEMWLYSFALCSNFSLSKCKRIYYSYICRSVTFPLSTNLCNICWEYLIYMSLSNQKCTSYVHVGCHAENVHSFVDLLYVYRSSEDDQWPDTSFEYIFISYIIIFSL